MAVHERAYRPYTGERVSELRRLLVIPRYAIQDAFRSRMFTSLFVGSLLPFAVCLIILYLPHNAKVIQHLRLDMTLVDELVSRLFDTFLRIQTGFAFFIVLLQAPLVVASDLRNNALALYLSRPFSRLEYLLGNFLTLALVLSVITWIPGLLLFAFQTYLMGLEWAGAHLRFAGGIFVGAWLFMTFISLMGLAASAWSRSKAVARGAIATIFFFMGGLGELLNEMLKTEVGDLLSIPLVTERLYSGLMEVDALQRFQLSTLIVTMLGYSAVCAALLYRQIRAYEVVR